jgi:hypothetical protein
MKTRVSPLCRGKFRLLVTRMIKAHNRGGGVPFRRINDTLGEYVTMSLSKFARFAIPAIAAFTVSIAVPAAMAQTAMAPATSTKVVKTKTVAKPNGAVVTTKTVTTKDRYNTIAAAQSTCPTDTVVWSSFTSTHSFHMSTSKYFGKTKHGAYICEQTALGAGYHQSKT